MRNKKLIFSSIFLSLFLFSSIDLEATKTSLHNEPIGSSLTDAEESLTLSQDLITATLIKKASSDYAVLLQQYENSSLTWQELQEGHDKIFTTLLTSIKGQIEISQEKIHMIANDYDAEHEALFEHHLQLLLGLTQKNLGIPANQVILPPLPSNDPTYPNLIQGGDVPSSKNWTLTYGSGTLVNGQIITTNPNGASFSQSVLTIPNHWYLISGQILGANEGVDKYGNKNVYSGTISVINANKDFPQSSDELDEGKLHRRYFWVQAEDTSMTICLNGSQAINSDEGPSFQNISVRDLNLDCSLASGQLRAMSLAQIICPPTLTTGSPEAGWYPQVEKNLIHGDNLIDGTISIMGNIDMTALGNAGHPYWYFGKENENPVDKNIKIINGLNGAHGLFLPAGADPITNGPLPIPKANYTLTCTLFAPENVDSSIRISFCGTNLRDGSQLDKIYQDFINLPTGQNTLTLKIPSSSFPSDGVFFRPSITFENTGTSSFNIYNVTLIPDSDEVYTIINTINPYNLNRSWYDPNGCNITYDFTNNDISFDFGIALTGNTMFSANPKDVMVSDQGIILNSHSVNPTLFDGGGIQSTQLIDPMRDFTISVMFTALENTFGYEPTFAVWTYGESQRGPDDPLSHRNGSGSDLITEFDCEIGSDPSQGQPPADPSKMYMRPGSYIGYEAGGHNEKLPSESNWPLIPNLWQKNTEGTYDPYILTISGTWINGALLLVRTFENTNTKIVNPIDTQNLGKGPFSPMYIKIALENPVWNTKSHTVGQASLSIQKITLYQGKDIPENVNHKIPLSEMDYTWFTPGGGGGLSYTPFSKRTTANF